MGNRWWQMAACVGHPTEWFFPDGGGERAYDRGKTVCAGCTVRAQCLALAQDFVTTGDRYGLFGGLTPTERRMARREDAHRVFIKR